MNKEKNDHRTTLQNIAFKAMLEREMLPEFSLKAIEQLHQIENLSVIIDKTSKDLRHMPWCSIDNDDSKDLDQLTVAQTQANGIVKIFVAIADVDSLVKKDSAIDEHAKHNTTSIYTAAQIFPMLPQKLSTDLTSLNLNQDRNALVIEMDIDEKGKITNSSIYTAIVKNYAKLAYNSVATWLEGNGDMPEEISRTKELEENIRVQDQIAQLLLKNRYEYGALNLETIQTRPVFNENVIQSLEIENKNRAKELIENFMITANTVTAEFLKAKGIPSLRRVVRQPKRWDRIVEVAAQHSYQLPLVPNAEALSLFLEKQKDKDQLRFPDLCLTIIKLLGRGEYIVEFPDQKDVGHFGLAVMDYTHSTAPNRRFPDLITQRMIKAAINNNKIAYQPDELIQLAQHCTKKEDDANKVERQVSKSAAALLLSSRIGENFDAICTGAGDKGTWVRIFQPPTEGRLTGNFSGIDVGNKVRVQLVYTDVEKGHIDFKMIKTL